MSSTHNSKALRGMESLESILRSAAILSGIWAAYKVLSRLEESAGSGQRALRQFLDEQAQARRARQQADRDTDNTLREQDRRDTEQIRKELRRDQIERERRKRPQIPPHAKGRWDGNVFIPEAKEGKP